MSRDWETAHEWVSLDGESFRCSHFLVDADGCEQTWNGWLVPVFTNDQMQVVRDFFEDWYESDDGWEEVAPNEWVAYGWCWSR